MKKKLTALVLAFVLILSMGLAACDKPNPDSDSYTVTFMNGSAVFETQTIISGGTASVPASNPAKSGYTFVDWYEVLSTDGTGSGTAFVFTAAVTNDITLHAAFAENAPPATVYTVTFMNGTEVFETRQIEDGKSAAKPAADPVKNNYTFDNWYEELNADGTGKGTAFNFSTAITKSITLYASYTENAYVTAYVYYDMLYYAQKLHESGTFYPSNYGMEVYDFSDWEVAVLEEAADFSIDAKYAYLDIRELAAENTIEYDSYIVYMYSGEAVDYWLEDYGDYIKLNVYDSNWRASYYVSAQGMLIICENRKTYEEYYIIQDTAYQITEWISIEGSITADAVFWSEYCSEGFVLLWPSSYTLKAEYIEVYFNLGSTYESLIITEGHQFDLSVYEKEGYDVSFYYNKYIEIILPSPEVFSAENIARYISLLSETEFRDLYFDENFGAADEYDFYYNIWGYADGFEVYIEMNKGADCYYFNIVDGFIVYGNYGLDDGNSWTDYSLMYNSAIQSYAAYTQEDAEFTGTIPSDQFAIYKALDKRFNINAYYLKTFEFDVECTVDEVTVFGLTVDESGIYTIEFNVSGANVDYTYIYSDMELTNMIGYFWNDSIRGSFVLLAGQTYYLEFGYSGSPYSFIVSKFDTAELEEGLVLSSGYNGTIADDKFYAYTFIPETDGIYTITVTISSQDICLYAGIYGYINFNYEYGSDIGDTTFTFTAELEAGMTYYIEVGGDDGAQFTLTVELNN